jgi:hypothetical protein
VRSIQETSSSEFEDNTEFKTAAMFFLRENAVVAEEDSAKEGSSIPIPVIAAAGGGAGICCLCIAIVAFFAIKRRRSNNDETDNELQEVSPTLVVQQRTGMKDFIATAISDSGNLSSSSDDLSELEELDPSIVETELKIRENKGRVIGNFADQVKQLSSSAVNSARDSLRSLATSNRESKQDTKPLNVVDF